jgi:hypothetical protein
MMWENILYENCYVGKFNIIVMGVEAGLQKSKLLYRKTLYPGASNSEDAVQYKLVYPKLPLPTTVQTLQFS